MGAWITAVLVAAPLMLLAPPQVPESQVLGAADLSAAARLADRLQDTARVLRNGARVGAAAPMLARERDRLQGDLESLIQAHHHWLSAASPDERLRAEPRLAEVQRGCERMRVYLEQLSAAIVGDRVDRARVAVIGQGIGHQAAICERALRQAARDAAA